jgi:hypothetical protein
VAELADALDLGSSGETHGGSSPPVRINESRSKVRGQRSKQSLSLYQLAASRSLSTTHGRISPRATFSSGLAKRSS